MANLYVIAAAETGPFKVGISGDPSRRMRGMQTSCATELSLLHEVHLGEDARHVETLVHKRLSDSRMKGEWFKAPAAEVIAAVTAAIETLALQRQNCGFGRWIRTQAHRDDPTGDLARDMASDRACPASPSYAVLRPKMLCDGARAALDASFAEWLSYCGNTTP